MKTHARKLLFIIPLLPLLMANSPAPKVYDEQYNDLEVTYSSEECYHNYYFYHFNLKNTGNGYAHYVNFTNDRYDESFYASVNEDEIFYPFVSALYAPGFDDEVIVVTKNKIPDSKKVVANAYAYSEIAEEITISGSKALTYSVEQSDPSIKNYAYELDISVSGRLSDYYYGAAVKVTYDGKDGCLKIDNLQDKPFIRTSERIDLSKLTVHEVVAYKSARYYYGANVNWNNALTPLLTFLLIFGLLLSFGIFSAIFFPAMARRKRRNRQNASNK